MGLLRSEHTLNLERKCSSLHWKEGWGKGMQGWEKVIAEIHNQTHPSK